MSRCRHPRVTVYETVETERRFKFIEGHLDTYSSTHVPPRGRVLVHCHSCGLTRHYSVGRYPKWLRKLMEAIPKEVRS